MLYLTKYSIMKILEKIVSKLRYWLLALFLVPIFSVWICNAGKDLMQQIMEKADQYWTTIHVASTTKGVWKDVFVGWTRPLDPLNEWLGFKKVPSIIVKVTRLLLSLVVALSVTMILYNWLTYIIQTWQWKEWKNLVKNVVYIVIWIILSLFSITIITILQSVSKSLDEETDRDRKRNNDEKVIEYNDKKMWIIWSDIFNETDE